jgi:EAL domain-containing protein (putative c-di-GMP-specific phosphodiesterase class I)
MDFQQSREDLAALAEEQGLIPQVELLVRVQLVSQTKEVVQDLLDMDLMAEKQVVLVGLEAAVEALLLRVRMQTLVEETVAMVALTQFLAHQVFMQQVVVAASKKQGNHLLLLELVELA